MDPISILEGIAATLICSVSGSFFKWLIKRSRETRNEPKKQRHTPKRLVHCQFFLSLFFLMISFAVFFSVRGSGFLYLFARYASAGTALICYLLIWGAFDAAYTFYPLVNNPNENSAKEKTDTKTDDPVDVR